MKKFLAILFSVVVTLGAITVLGANVNDPYEFDGDVITNPFWWLYTTEAPETQTEPTTVGANWVLVGQNSNNNYYYDKANMTVNEVVSIQQPGWSSELGIYFNVSEAITSVTVNGVSQNVASIDGAGAVVYLSALTQAVNEVIVKYGNSTAKVLFKKEALPETEAPTEKPTEAPTEAPTEKPTVAPVELKITSQPQDVMVKAGTTANFNIKAQGEGLKYQWQVSSSNGERWGNTSLAGNKTTTLTLTAAANYDGRLYRCIVTDKYGKTVTSNAAKLSFSSTTGTVKITSQPTDVKTGVGKIVSFKVVAEGVGLKYQWQTSSSNGAKWGNTSLSGNNTALLSFSAPATYDGRLYRCVITDAKGNTVVSEAAKLSIGEATGDSIIINAQPKDVSVAAGSATSFIVEATGEGLTYQWQVSSSNGERWGNTSLAGAKTNILQLVAPSNYNGRLYRCVICLLYTSDAADD